MDFNVLDERGYYPIEYAFLHCDRDRMVELLGHNISSVISKCIEQIIDRGVDENWTWIGENSIDESTRNMVESFIHEVCNSDIVCSMTKNPVTEEIQQWLVTDDMYLLLKMLHTAIILCEGCSGKQFIMCHELSSMSTFMAVRASAMKSELLP